MLSLYLSLLEDHNCDNKLIEIYNNYKNWMLMVAYSFLEDQELSKDAIHDVFLNLVKKIRTIPDENMNVTKAYLYIAIKHACIDIIKRRKSNITFNIDDQFNLHNNTNIEKEIETKYLYDKVLEYIDSMPYIYKEVITLHIVHDIKLTDVAKILNIPFKTAQSRYLRARKLIRKNLGDLI